MSDDVSVFIRGSSVDVLLEVLLNQFHTPVKLADPTGMATMTGEAFGIAIAVIADHGLEDDGGIAFSQYPLQVAFTRYAGGMDAATGRELCIAMARVFAHTIRDVAAVDHLVVEGVQRVIDQAGR